MEGPARAAHTERGMDRITIFTDAVVAIAATFLIVPVIDLYGDAISEGEDLSVLSAAVVFQVAIFLATFTVMTVLWWQHHEVFERLKGYSRALIVWNFLWLFSIVFLAFPGGYLNGPLGTVNAEFTALYFFSMGFSWTLLNLTRVYVFRHPELLVDPDSRLPRPYRLWSWLPPASLFSLALAFLLIGVLADGPISWPNITPVWLLAVPLAIWLASSGPRRPPVPHTERGMDRIVFFPDAVVAIAITFLLLPLLDTVPSDSADFQLLDFSDSTLWAKIAVFAFTFWVMSRQWLVNHRLFENVNDYSQGLWKRIYWWLLLIVVLAIPSALMGHALATKFGVKDGAYQELTDNFMWISLLFGTVMALISLTTALTERYLRHHPELLVDPTQLPSPRANYYVAILYLVLGALPLALIWVDLNTIGFGLFLSVLLAPFVSRLAERQDAAKRAASTQTQV